MADLRALLGSKCDETIETAARALDAAWNPDRYPVLAAMFRDYAQTALAAVLPDLLGDAEPIVYAEGDLTARTQPEDATIRAWLDRAREYPTASGARGWVTDRDGLIALLSECYVGGISASVIPHAVDEDMVTFHVQLSVSFARSELTDPTGNAAMAVEPAPVVTDAHAAEPIVRTVGDLTARHRLARPRIRVAGRVGTLKLVKPSDAYPGTLALIWGDWWEDVASEEPCEVLP